MALYTDGHGDAVAGVDHPGVLSWANEHLRALGGEAAQVHPRRLVRTVLAPHDGVHGQFEVVWLPAQDASDRRGLVVGQSQLAVQRYPHETARLPRP